MWFCVLCNPQSFDESFWWSNIKISKWIQHNRLHKNGSSYFNLWMKFMIDKTRFVLNWKLILNLIVDKIVTIESKVNWMNRGSTRESTSTRHSYSLFLSSISYIPLRILTFSDNLHHHSKHNNIAHTHTHTVTASRFVHNESDSFVRDSSFD